MCPSIRNVPIHRGRRGGHGLDSLDLIHQIKIGDPNLRRFDIVTGKDRNGIRAGRLRNRPR